MEKLRSELQIGRCCG